MLEAAAFSFTATIAVFVEPSLNAVTWTPFTGSAVASILVQPGRMNLAYCARAQSLFRMVYVPAALKYIKLSPELPSG
jgi:hypothetical protein